MLKVQNITKSFGGIIANNNITFNVEQGDIMGLIGPNGAGKSTLFNIISSIYPPSKGEVVYQEKRIDGLPPFRIAPLGISRTFQNLQVFNHMSVLENVMVGHHTQKKSGILKAAFRLNQVRQEEKDIYDKAQTYLELVGLEKDLEKEAGSLSLGKLRLLEFARALATEPDLILFDEIVSGLNQKETHEMSNLIQKVRKRGTSILIVEHDMELIMSICDQVVVLDQGKKIAEGPPEEIQNNDSVITAYLGADMEQGAK